MGDLKTGDYTYGQNNLQRRGEMNNVTIGKFCQIASNVVLDSGFNHETKWISTFPFASRFGFNVPHNAVCKGDINIGNDVWIGENVTIMSGVTIGDGAVIGANSIVTKNVSSYYVVAGSPARYIKRRFTDNQITALLKIQWWNWPIEKIQENAHLLMSEDLTQFIKLHGSTD